MSQKWQAKERVVYDFAENVERFLIQKVFKSKLFQVGMTKNQNTTVEADISTLQVNVISRLMLSLHKRTIQKITK
jgi:hypothetical protein